MEDKLRKIVVALAMAAVVLGGVLAYVWTSKSKLVNDLNIEKADLTQEMEELRQEYAELQTANDTLNANLQIEREHPHKSLLKNIFLPFTRDDRFGF